MADTELTAPSIPKRDDDRLWAAFAHLGGVVSILPALLIFLAYKDSARFATGQAKEALNFQMTLVGTYLATIVGGLLLGAVSLDPVDWVHVALGVALAIVSVVFSIMGFTSASRGVAYRYPVCLRLIR
ncbi:MAG TPA: DUF4870 domain-containing protein [Galbitalea sp.]|jgi:hypothetical protein|nr:DUF4870 domain-containing protein [Galbitalea sp.]